MMKRILMTLALAWLLLPIPWNGEAGQYNTNTGLAWCTDARTCRHEYAHHLDQVNGWPSRSIEYRDALATFVMVEMKVTTRTGDPLAIDIVKMAGLPIEEIYAEIYAATMGDVPASLAKFYPHYNGDVYQIQLTRGVLQYGIRDSSH